MLCSATRRTWMIRAFAPHSQWAVASALSKHQARGGRAQAIDFVLTTTTEGTRLSVRRLSTLGTISESPVSRYSNTTAQHQQQQQQQRLSSLALVVDESEDDDEEDDENAVSTDDEHKTKHCDTCTCDEENHATAVSECELGAMQRQEPFPPPLAEPKYTFLRRVLDPSCTTALDSSVGKQCLIRSLVNDTAESYVALMSHFTNQSEPAYCGVTTLLIVLNAFCVDPAVRWKGGWRYFGNEEVLLEKCCLDPERVRRVGIHMTQFAQLASCQGLTVELKRPSSGSSLDEFRRDVKAVLTKPETATADDPLRSLLVVSYARWSLGQTGNAGHFSPIAAYDEETDSVLILDVARFKYPPYWCRLDDLYSAMEPTDPSTQQSRGWLVLHPPTIGEYYQGSKLQHEGKIPANQVPQVGRVAEHCPAQSVKVEYCSNNNNNNNNNNPQHSTRN